MPVPEVSMGLVCFRVEPSHGTGIHARLFDAGAPNRVDDPWRPAKMTEITLGLDNRSSMKIGHLYIARFFWVKDSILILPPRGPTKDTDITVLEMFSSLLLFRSRPQLIVMRKPAGRMLQTMRHRCFVRT